MTPPIQVPSHPLRGHTQRNKLPATRIQLHQEGFCIHFRTQLLASCQQPLAPSLSPRRRLWLCSPDPHLRPVFPGGHRQRPMAGSQGALPTQSQSCWHPSPYVPSLQPGLRGEIGHTRSEHTPRAPACSPREDGYLSGSARRRTQRDRDSDRWLGHSRLRAHSRSAPGSQLHGIPGDSLVWSRRAP